jgi:hypothetical protein
MFTNVNITRCMFISFTIYWISTKCSYMVVHTILFILYYLQNVSVLFK